MLKKVIITVIVLFLVVLVYVRTSTAIKDLLTINSLSHLSVRAIHSLNSHIEKMDPTVKKERAESIERLAKNLQPFIKPFFESGMGKNQKDPETSK